MVRQQQQWRWRRGAAPGATGALCVLRRPAHQLAIATQPPATGKRGAQLACLPGGVGRSACSETAASKRSNLASSFANINAAVASVAPFACGCPADAGSDAARRGGSRSGMPPCAFAGAAAAELLRKSKKTP